MSKFVEYLRAQIGSIYVWGAQGENVLAEPDPLKWIRSKETSEENAQRAWSLFRERQAAGIDPILAYDCSGLIVNFLLENGIIKGDRNAQMLYDLCDMKLNAPTKVGDFCFRYVESSKKIVHIGVYVGDGKVIEAKGRDAGVVESELASYPWNRFGRLEALMPYLTDYPDEPVLISVQKPMLQGEGIALLQETLNALGYKDANGNLLVVDGKWGKLSQSALDVFMDMNMSPTEYCVTITASKPTTLVLEEHFYGV